MGLLRFLLAMAVVLTHAGPLFGGYLADNRIAVQSFYAISGFYIAMIWNEKYRHLAGPYRAFVLSRALRVYPMYLLVLAATFVVGRTVGGIDDWRFRIVAEHYPLSAGGTLAVIGSQLSLIGSELHLFFYRLADGSLAFTSNFAKAPPPGLFFYMLVPQAWSLSLELMFYLIAPWVVGSLRWTLLLAAASLLLRLAFVAGGLQGDPWSYRFFPLELMFFLSGAAAYRMGKSAGYASLCSWLGRGRGLVVLAILVYLFALRAAYGLFGEAAVWCFYGVLIAGLPMLFAVTANNAADRFIGELSFPIYLSHFLVLWLVEVAWDVESPRAALYVVPITVAVSCVLVFAQAAIDRFRHGLFLADQTSRTVRTA